VFKNPCVTLLNFVKVIGYGKTLLRIKLPPTLKFWRTSREGKGGDLGRND